MTTDELLDEIALRQYAWKNTAMIRVTCAICEAALKGGVFWPDQVDTSSIATEDRNCIGSTYRNLRRLGIINLTGRFRRSQGERTHGRVVFEYQLQSRTLAETLLTRFKPNTEPDPRQIDLFPLTATT